MSEVRRWAHTVAWEGLQISATYMAINDGGEYVMHDDYAALEAECERLRELVGDYICKINEEKKGLVSQANMTSAARRERDALRAELAITRRVIDRIGQLCTTPHESKERFIRRVQSVIEWEAQALSAEASP